MCVGVLYGDSFDEEAWQGCDNAMFKSTYIYVFVSLQFYMLVSLQFYSCLQCVCVCVLSMVVHLTKEVRQGLSNDLLNRH